MKKIFLMLLMTSIFSCGKMNFVNMDKREEPKKEELIDLKPQDDNKLVDVVKAISLEEYQRRETYLLHRLFMEDRIMEELPRDASGELSALSLAITYGDENYWTGCVREEDMRRRINQDLRVGWRGGHVDLFSESEEEEEVEKEEKESDDLIRDREEGDAEQEES